MIAAAKTTTADRIVSRLQRLFDESIVAQRHAELDGEGNAEMIALGRSLGLSAAIHEIQLAQMEESLCLVSRS